MPKIVTQSMLWFVVFATIIIITASSDLLAQTPTYQYTWYPALESQPGGTGTAGTVRIQGLYTSANFPGMPAGRVKAIYVRVSNPYQLNNGGGGPCVVAGVTAKIGYTSDTVYKSGQDTFRVGLTTIYGPDTFTISCAGSKGDWIRIPVTKGNFHYKPEGAKFAVEISSGPQTNPSMILPMIMNSIGGQGQVFWKKMYSLKLTDKIGGVLGTAMDLGFDLGQPADVDVPGNVASFGLFPNPSTDGRFNISFDAQQAINEARLSVTDVTGKIVLQQQYGSVGRSFFKEIDLGTAAKGIYFVEVVADGERIVRRMLIQ